MLTGLKPEDLYPDERLPDERLRGGAGRAYLFGSARPFPDPFRRGP